MRKNLPVTDVEYPITDETLIVSRTDTKGRLTYFNDDFMAASGFAADDLLGKLKAGGLKPYTEKVATQAGDRTRIRVGPFASKEEADKARAKILKLGLNATLLPA